MSSKDHFSQKELVAYYKELSYVRKKQFCNYLVDLLAVQKIDTEVENYRKELLEAKKRQAEAELALKVDEIQSGTHRSREDGDKRRCSFCHRSEDDVLHMIEGPDGLYICDKCVAICHDVMEIARREDEKTDNAAGSTLREENDLDEG